LTDAVERGLKRIGITVSKPVLGILCIIFGVIVLVAPVSLAIIVGIFLLIEGILLLTEYAELARQQPSTSSQS
jgi:uncharacterized membrane protein HdeD (DUF308 family)